LTFKQGEFEILDWSKFRKEVGSDKDPYTKYVYNPNIKTEGYKPRLTIYDKFGITARVEFSAPKILKGNNFDEIDESDFEMLVHRLSYLLGSMYISVTPEQLRKTEVSKIDYSKNIIFTDHTTSSMILNELNKIDLTARLDQTTKDFKNKGQKLVYHANSYEICFYDKRKELEQYKKYGSKRTDEDGTIQPELLGRMAFDPLEVFRIEYRLCTKRKIKEVFAKYGIETDIKFESVFKRDISKTLLVNTWKLFENKFDYTLHNTKDPMTFLESIFQTKPKTSLLHALAYAKAFEIASSDAGGMRKFKDCIDKYSYPRAWGRIKDQLKGIKLAPDKTKLEMLLKVGKQLEEFTPVKLKDYPQFENLTM
jgi:hypothetical protein